MKSIIQREKKYLNRLLPDYKAYWIGYLKVRARLDDILEFNDRAIKKPLPTSGDREAQAQWDKLISILSTSDEFTNYMYDTYDPGQGILAGVHIVNYQSLMRVPALNPLDNRQREVDKLMTNFKYTSRTINLNAINLKEAIENGLCKKFHRDNECWINALFTLYHKTLLNQEKKRCLITREIIYQIINKTNVSVREGLNVHDLLTCFGTRRELKSKLGYMVFMANE